MRTTILLLLLAAATLAQSGDRVVLVVEKDVRAEVKAGLEAGAVAALLAAWPDARLAVLDYKKASAKGALDGAAGCVLFLPARKSGNPFRIASAAGIPVIDLGQSRLAGPKAPLTPYGDPAVQAENAAWWLATSRKQSW